MKKLLFLATLLILMASCNYTPEERVERVVKKYCTAIQKQDWKEKNSLTYVEQMPEVEVVDCCVEVVEGEEFDADEPLVSNLKIHFNRQYLISDNSKFNIVSINKIYSKALQKQTSENPWPSDIIAAYEVEVDSENNKIIFTVVQLGEKDFKIYSTNDLYSYDLSEVIEKTGCDSFILPDVNDDEMYKNINMLIDNLETFDVFSSAVAANDSAKIIRVFPGIANQDYEFNGRPVPKSYIQNDLYVTITTNDSLVFKMSNGKIEDSYGVISSKHAEDAVKALDGTPYSRDRYFDIEYVNVLSKQADSLQKEKERKAKAAKYKAQGLALISSHFANDGNGAKGIGFSVLNTSNKTAKYVIIEVVGYNSVDDPVWSDGYIMRCRGIGPVYPGDWGEWEFDNIWERGSIVRSYEIKTIIMQYTDGTSKSIKLPQPLPLNWKDWLY